MNANDGNDKARALFERAARGLDADAAKRLRLARREALARSAPSPAFAWLPTLAMTGVLVLGLAWWLPRSDAVPAPGPEAAAPVEEIVLAEVDDDADLYAWLAEAPVAADAPEQRL